MDWFVEFMQCKPFDGEYADVVVTAGWRCNAVDGDASATAYGLCTFPAPGDNFTAYEDLTESQVLGWCWENGVDKNAVEAALRRELDDKLNPPVVQNPLPWIEA